MARMKTLLKYLIWGVAFYILSNVLISIGLKNEYRDLTEISNDAQSPIVSIMDAEATSTNGKVSGIIENNTNEFISTKYIKVDLYSKRGINLGTEYYKITAVEPGEKKEFDFDFHVDNVEKYSVTLTDDAECEEDQFILLPNLTASQRLLVYVTSFILLI